MAHLCNNNNKEVKTKPVNERKRVAFRLEVCVIKTQERA